jgi:hypothetical protein
VPQFRGQDGHPAVRWGLIQVAQQLQADRALDLASFQGHAMAMAMATRWRRFLEEFWIAWWYDKNWWLYGLYDDYMMIIWWFSVIIINMMFMMFMSKMDYMMIIWWYMTAWWWLEPWNFMTFHILGIITPANWYFSEGLKPPTSNDLRMFKIQSCCQRVNYSLFEKTNNKIKTFGVISVF